MPRMTITKIPLELKKTDPYDPMITPYEIEDKIVTGNLPFSKVDHIGIVVKDIDKAVAHYQALGIGPFKKANIIVKDRIEYGKPTSNHKEIRMAKIGDFCIEMMQPVSGESFPKRFLESRGEGINHLAFSVDDINKETAKLIDKGFNAISTAKFEDGGGFVYFGTDIIGGVIFELVQWPPETH